MSYKIAKLCAWNTWENRNALSWKIRNLENHCWIILRSVKAIAFCRSCHSVGRMDLEVLVNRHLRVRWMTVFVIRAVMSYSCSPMYCICSIHSEPCETVTCFKVFFQFVSNVLTVIFFKEGSRKIEVTHSNLHDHLIQSISFT